MASVNKVFLIGNLTRDPELRYTPNGAAVTDLGLATNRVYVTKDGDRREEVTFVDFARSEGRFAKHFDKDGNPSPTVLMAKQDRLENWHLLQELAGLR